MSNKLSLLVQFGSVDKLSGALKNIMGLGKGGAASLRQLNASARETRTELAGVQKALAGATGNVTALVDRERALAVQLDRTNADLARRKQLLALDASNARASARGDALQGRGQSNMIGGAAMALPFLGAAKAAMDFESGMIDIRDKAGLSADETRRLRDYIISAAKEAKRFPEEMRGGLDVLAGFGMSPSDAKQMLRPIGRAATASKAEIADLAASAHANFLSLKVPVSDTALALDAMTLAGKEGAFELKDMAQSFPALAAQANAFGETGVAAVADLAAALQVARDKTGDAASAANNLINLFAKINMKETRKKFGEMGIDLETAMARAKADGQTTLEAITNISRLATKGDISKLSLIFGDMQAQAAVRALMQEQEKHLRIRSKAMNARGTIDAGFALREEDPAAQFHAMRGQLSSAALELGKKMLPALTEFGNKLSIALDKVAAFTAKHPQLTSALVQGAAALVGLRIGFGALQFLLGGIIGPVTTTINAFRKLNDLGLLKPILTGLRSALSGAGKAILFVGRALLMTPIGLIATAIGVAAYVIWKHWDKIKAAFTGAWDKIKNMSWADVGKAVLQGLANGILGAPGLVLNALLSVAKRALTGVKSFLGIRSPSRVFFGIGGHVAEGLALGVSANARRPIAAMGALSRGLASGFTPPTAIRPAAAARGAGSAFASSGFGPVNITINAGPGADARGIADEVLRRLKELEARNRRSSYADA